LYVDELNDDDDDNDDVRHQVQILHEHIITSDVVARGGPPKF